MITELVGRTIRAVCIDPEHETLALHTDVGWLIGRCYGDCCSETYVCHISGLAAVLSAWPVLSVQELSYPAEHLDTGSAAYMHAVRHGGWRQECETPYGVSIATRAGAMTIDFRNYSNGYYGGWIEWRWAIDPPETCQLLVEDF